VLSSLLAHRWRRNLVPVYVVLTTAQVRGSSLAIVQFILRVTIEAVAPCHVGPPLHSAVYAARIAAIPRDIPMSGEACRDA
jgi:hypothetical protein